MRWKEAKIIALHKPVKSFYTKARAYRLISLLNHLGKLLKTIVNNRLKKWIERHQVVSPFQWGFRLGRYVLGACWHLVEEVACAIRDRDQLRAVALDIQSAYDSVWRTGLSEMMQWKKLPNFIIYWIKSFMDKRRCQVQVGNAKVVCTPGCGLPPGFSPVPHPLLDLY